MKKMKTKKGYILVGNWKMNPGSYTEARALFRATAKRIALFPRLSVVMCPPAIFIRGINAGIEGVLLGAQDVLPEPSGSYTGGISVSMLAESGVSHVIVGHSECRKRGDTNEIINRKMHAVLNAGLTAIVCIGEDSRTDKGEYLGFLRTQIAETLAGISKKNIGRLIIAYEPVWAIGAASAMSPHDVHETGLFIRKTMTELFKGIQIDSFPLLYGGSVDPQNAYALVHNGMVEGLLVGRQSLDPLAFSYIAELITA